MRRFYCPAVNISTNKIIINDINELHHIKDVLRLKTEDNLILFDDKGNEYGCSIKEITNNRIILTIKDRRLPKIPKVKITVACAIPKKSKMDEIVDGLTQLGVDRIIPMQTERVIVKLDRNKMMTRCLRWNKIAQNASEQSQRNTLPMVDKIMDIRRILSISDNFDLKLILTLEGERKNIKEILAKANPKNILVLIGPEGDFTHPELDLAKKAGCAAVSLGDSVLRVETAAVAIVSVLRLVL